MHAYHGDRQAFGITRRGFTKGALALGAFAAVLPLSGCGTGQGASTASTSQRITIGTMPTEDLLPFFVAADEDLFSQAGLDVAIETFQSAQELSVAVTSGDVQLAMTDPMVAASLFAGKTAISMEWVTLGTEASQGRFGVQTAAGSGYTSLAELAGIPVGVGSDTVPEYVFDVLMARAGVPDGEIVGEELKKLPVRFQMMQSGQVAAAALPGSMLALGEATGCITLADDTQGENISASVMVARADFSESDGGGASLPLLTQVWDDAAGRINSDPDAFRSILIANANLSDAVAGTYPISAYPLAQRPSAALVDPILAWMQRKGYLTAALAYDEGTGTFSA